MRFLPVLLSLLAAPMVWAQAVPDTTSPWRYYPLAVGNAWEYKEFGEETYYRRVVTGDTTFNGRRYFVVHRYRAEDGGPIGPDFPRRVRLRFDTTSALVYEPFVDGSGMEREYIPCPLDAPFNTTIFCEAWAGEFFVEGSYEGVLVFGGDEPGEGGDTVRTSVKSYYESPGETAYRYAAGFGEVYFSDSWFSTYGLYYARIDGVEHGVPRYPTVGIEEPAGYADNALTLSVSPNPVRGAASVVFVLVEPGTVRIALYDALGREVAALLSGEQAAGRHGVTFDGTGIPPGVYFVRVAAAGAVVARPLTLFR
ncbi:MAG TPA: T9SS type A sorting domain-containing protein [Rubricoccaceae bacterium]|nr:T9SS type A sorting domain-containing protein [Rubricoccaceae bacterium]